MADVNRREFVTSVAFSLGAAPIWSRVLAQTGPASTPLRVPRAQGFVGLHFDYHAGKDSTEIGKNTTRAMIENIIDRVHPDFIQIDSKGHAGFSSYPTKVGNPAPGFVE